MAREYELKFLVRDRGAVMVGLKEAGFELSTPVRQIDQAYAPAGWQDGEDRTGITFARLRTVDDRHTFTTKTPVTGVLDCIEYETEVTDREGMHQAVLAMGYRPTVTIAKTRQTATAESISVCLDSVDGIGDFLEVEYLADQDTRPDEAEAALWRAVPESIDPADRVLVGYDSLVAPQHTAHPS